MQDIEDLADSIANRIETSLNDLGSTPFEVYENLLALGHYGVPKQADMCPVWKLLDAMALESYVTEVVGECDFVNFEVDAGGILFEFMSHLQWAHRVIEPPAAVYDFIVNFDDGLYPQLCAS